MCTTKKEIFFVHDNNNLFTLNNSACYDVYMMYKTNFTQILNDSYNIIFFLNISDETTLYRGTKMEILEIQLPFLECVLLYMFKLYISVFLFGYIFIILIKLYFSVNQ